jgi:hypothetical protein
MQWGAWITVGAILLGSELTDLAAIVTMATSIARKPSA